MSKHQPGNALMHNYKRIPLRFTHGEGCHLFAEDGSSYLDFTSGIGVNSLGHAHPRLTAELQDQVGKLLHVSNLYDESLQIRCAARLAKACALGQVFFCNSGTEAGEAAIKLARRVQFDAKRSEQRGILAVESGFHGRTLGTLSCTANEKYRRPFEPLLPGCHWIKRNDLAALERELRSQNYAAFFVEAIQGEAGVYALNREFLHQAMALCKETHTVFVVDEVQSGGGRSGRFLASQSFGIEADIVTLAKPLAGGIPIGAVVASQEIAQHFVPGDHGSTFGGNPLACRAALVVLSELFDHGLLEHVDTMGKLWGSYLEELSNRHEAIDHHRGLGLMRAIVLKEPHDNAAIAAALRERGLLVIPSPENSLRMLPPFVISDEELACATDMLDQELASL
ncbi:MAG: aspartate aminotransferase family protein [Planctomycetota bacterium]|nr:MAG: aspartate aminotransferase family protein [Planctomycetota bacterium]